jgi:hypothetical protein
MEQARFYDMPGINVWVAPIEPEIAEDGLDREQIRSEVEKKLFGTGLPVIENFDVRQAPEFPCLGVLLNAVRYQEDPPAYTYSIEMFFLQRITMAGPPVTDAMHMVWCRESTGDITRTAQGFNWSNLYETLDFLVDSFIVECFHPKASVGQLQEARPS